MTTSYFARVSRTVPIAGLLPSALPHRLAEAHEPAPQGFGRTAVVPPIVASSAEMDAPAPPRTTPVSPPLGAGPLKAAESRGNDRHPEKASSPAAIPLGHRGDRTPEDRSLRPAAEIAERQLSEPADEATESLL